MKIVITGGSGFIGSNLAQYLTGRGHEVVAISRSAGKGHIHAAGYRYVSADTTRSGAWQTELEDASAVINLAGATIFKRWTTRYKQQIYDSRILTTRQVVSALGRNQAITFFSASATGYYGSRADEILTEDKKAGNDFLAGVSRDWEKAARQAAEKGARVVTMRFGVVLGKGGGAMAKMMPAYKFFAGGPLGDGNQWFPWIHMDDLTAAVGFVLEHRQIEGAFNFCAPQPVRNHEMAAALGEVLNRPAWMPMPAFVLRLILGEFADVFLGSQRAVPDRLLGYGFGFRYPQIQQALADIATR